MAVPDQVTGLKAAPRSGDVYLSWDIPDDNGDPILNYIKEFKLNSAPTWTVFFDGNSPNPSSTINTLTNGELYNFRVRATNSTGTGVVSAVVSVTPIAGSFTELANVLLILKDHGADVDLSNAWSVIELEDAVPQSIKVTLSADFGEFLTRGAKIQKHDRIYLQVTDVRGNIFKDVFHVRKLKKPRKGGKGKKLILICPHQSEYLWKRNISLLSRRISGNEAVVQIVTQLNDPLNKGVNDPSVNTNTTFDPVTKKGIALDKGTSSIFIFEKKKLQEAFDKITDIEAQPVEGNGSFEPFYIRFKSDYIHSNGTLLDQVSIQAYPQGFVKNTASGLFSNIPNITLKHGVTADTTTNTLENDSDEEPELATNIHLVGGQKAGDFLGDYSKFFGAKNTFLNARTWTPTITFKRGSLVIEDGVVYEATALSTNQTPPNPSFWIVRTFTRPDDWSNVVSYAENALVVFQKIAYKKQSAGGDPVEPGTDDTIWRRVSFVPSTDYSPLTKQKAQYMVNALAGAKYATDVNKHNQTAMIDPNNIVKDKLHPRTMVRSVGISPAAIPSSHLVNSLIPNHYRMLVVDPTDGSELGVGVFAGSDRNGLSFAGNVVEFDDPDLDGQGEWIVFLARVTLQDQEVLDHDEGLPWVKFPGVPTFTLNIPDSYVNSSGDFVFVIGGGPKTRATNWRQGSYGLYEIPGVGRNGVFYGGGTLTVPNSPLGTKQFECAHSVKWDSGNNRVEVGNKGGLSSDDVDNNSAVFIKASANSAPSDEQNPFYVGFNFFPGLWPVSSNAVPFGAVVAGEKINTSTFDLDNMTRTAQGKINWFGAESESYRPIQSFAMWFEFIDTFVGSGLVQSEGDYEIGIFMQDARDNTRILPFTQGKNREIVPQEGKLPGQFYSGVPGASSTFSAREPEPTDAFDKNNILFAGIYTRDSFDTQGRYKSGSPLAILSQLLGGKVNRFAAASELEMAIDAFRPVKPLYITNADEPNALPIRNIDMVDQKKTDLTNYQTGKNLILGLARLFGFRQDKFEIDLEGRTDIEHGDCIYYTDTEIIDETTDSLPNTLKMVTDKIVYTFSKTLDGPAGFTAKASLVTRLYPDQVF